ncbi:hypothetical protein GW17_00010339, partial [Ensete ventricosum]
NLYLLVLCFLFLDIVNDVLKLVNLSFVFLQVMSYYRTHSVTRKLKMGCCGKLKGSFVGESMHDDGSVVFAYYKDGATDPTFLYFAYGLKEIKC